MKLAGSVFILRYTLALNFTTFIISNFSAVTQTNIDSVTQIKVAKKLFGSIDPTGENPIKKKSVVASYTSTFLVRWTEMLPIIPIEDCAVLFKERKVYSLGNYKSKDWVFIRLIKNQGIRCKSTHFEHSKRGSRAFEVSLSESEP